MRRSTQSEKVLKSISIALAAMVTSTTVMGSMGTMTVYAAEESSELETTTTAEESSESEKSTPPDNRGYNVIDNEADEYTNFETSGAKSVEEMNESVSDANEALDAADNLLNEIKEQLDTAAEKKEEAEEISKDIEGAVDAADTAAENAEKAVNGDAKVETDDAKVRANGIASDIKNFNDEVAANQDIVNNVTVTGLEVTHTEDGKEVTENLTKYVSDKATEAEAAKQDAYNALMEVLAVNTEDIEDDAEKRAEVEKKVAAVETAAVEAQKAADAAKEVYDSADESYQSALATYNYYAMLYGKPRYGEKTITYGEEELKAAGITQNAVDKMVNIENRADALKTELNGIDLTTLQNDIDDQKDVLDQAKKDLETALGAAQDAQDAANKALSGIDENEDGDNEDEAEGDKKGIVDFVNDAEKASDSVLDYYKNEVTTAQNEAKAKAGALEEAKADKLEDVINNASEIVSNGNEKVYHSLGFMRPWYGTEYEWQQRLLEKGTDEEKERAKEYIQKYNDAKAIKDAQDAYDEANKKLAEATAAKADAEQKRQQIIDEVNQKIKDDEVESFVQSIKDSLKNYSFNVNQIEFDQDLNAWANDNINSWDCYFTAQDIRIDMGKLYSMDSWKEFLNKWASTQWLISTKDTEAIMATAIEACRASMKTDEEKLAIVNAYCAYLQTAKKEGVAKESLTSIDEYIDTIKDAQTALTGANNALGSAQKRYNDAAQDLKEAQEIVNNLADFDEIKLKELMNKVKAAKRELNTAWKSLKAAEASAFTAQVYSEWANNLITDQEVRCYVRETKLEIGDDGVKSEPVKEYKSISPTKDGEVIKQTVPYELYKQYVSWLMKEKDEKFIFEKESQAKLPNGKGIAAGGSLGVVYWAIDEMGNIKVDDDGKATFYYEGQEPAGTYFVAYALKYESDKFYHLDGVYVTVTKNEETGEVETELPSDFTDSKDDPSPTTIDDQPVALAASVLGADRARTVENADEQIMVDQNGDVLGAERERGGDVLGAGRPQTGDYTNTGIALFGAVASGMMLLGYGLKKKKENEAEEC